MRSQCQLQLADRVLTERMQQDDYDEQTKNNSEDDHDNDNDCASARRSAFRRSHDLDLEPIMLSTEEVLIRLLMAALLGSFVGFERERRSAWAAQTVALQIMNWNEVVPRS